MSKSEEECGETGQRRVVIKHSIIRFINQHCQQQLTTGGGGSGGQDGDPSTLDEIVLDYVVGVLEDLLEQESPEDFDVFEFTEMLSAYFPSFGAIPHPVVLDWVHHLLHGLRKDKLQKKADALLSKDELFFGGLLVGEGGDVKRLRTRSATTETESSSSDENINNDFQRVRVCSESSASSVSTTSSSGKSSQSQLDLLCEMFPSLSVKDASGVLSLASGEMERAVQIVLLQMEDNLVVKSKGDAEEGGGDVKGLKDSIVKRYGFIDQAQDAKEFRPILPKEEPKKLVRYREGQVVSTKGERYTEVAVNANGEETKIKTYISKPHKYH